MNRLAIITGFLGEVRNRYMVYQGNRTLAEKLELASRIKGVDGLELCYPADFEKPAELKELLARYTFGISGINFRSRRSGKWWRGSFISEKASERQEVVSDLKRASAPARTGDDLALAVREGRADCGIATRAVAATRGLEFVSLAWERFDLVLRRRDYFEPGPQALFKLARSPELASRAVALGGYEIADSGTVLLNR